MHRQALIPNESIPYRQSVILTQQAPTGEKAGSACWVIPEILMMSFLNSPHS